MNHPNFLRFLIVPIVLFLTICVSRPASAQEGVPTPSDNEVNTIAKQMYCPVCENTPLDVCDTQACSQWRELIREKLALGWNSDQIKTYFVQQYGDRVLALPPIEGGSNLNILVYVVPILLVLGGLFFLVRVILRSKPIDRYESTRPHNITPEQEKVLSELEKELQRKKAEKSE